MPPCVRCQAEVPLGARFCSACGAAVPGAPPPYGAGAPVQVDGVTEAIAIVALLLNVFILPGLGSLIAKRREGWYQLGLAVFAFVFGLIGPLGVFVFGLSLGWLGGGPAWFIAPFVAVALGVIAGFAAWVWGIVTGVDVLRRIQVAKVATYG